MRTGPVVVPVFLLLSLSVAHAAQAQPGPERLEVAVNLSMLRVGDFGSTNAGIGGRLTFNLTKHVALEGDLEYTPNDRMKGPEDRIDGRPFQLYSDRSRATGLFGVKIGTYTPRFGVYGKARPGFTHLTSKVWNGCQGDGCGSMFARTDFLAISPVYQTEFAFDLGGGFEVYPSERTVARVEVGDTIIRNRGVTALPCLESCTSHNIASRVGFGWRF